MKDQIGEKTQASPVQNDENSPLTGQESVGERVEQQISPTQKHEDKTSGYKDDVWEALSIGDKSGLVAVVFLVLVGLGLSGRQEIIGSGLAIFVALIALSQYYVSRRQWFSMQEGLTETRNVITAMGAQRDLMHDQLAVMKAGLKLTEKMFSVSERAYVCIDGTPKMEDKTLRAQENNRFQLVLYNGGRTPAFNVRVRSFQHCTSDDIDTVADNIRDGLSGIQTKNTPRIILAGKPESLWTHAEPPLATADHALWENSRRNVYIAVEISYEDIHRDTLTLIYWYQFFNNRGFALMRPLLLEVSPYEEKVGKRTKADAKKEKGRQNPN